jgi:hypothetical protein
MRIAFAEIISKALSVCVKVESRVYSNYLRAYDRNNQDITLTYRVNFFHPLYNNDWKPFIEPEGSIRFMNFLLSFLEKTRKYSDTFQQYFTILSNFADLSGNSRIFLLTSDLLGNLIDYYMGQYSPEFQEKFPSSTRINLKKNTTTNLNLDSFFAVFSNILRQVAVVKGINQPHTMNRGVQRLVSKRDSTLLFNPNFLISLVRQCYSPHHIGVILTHIFYLNEPKLNLMCKVLAKAFANAKTLEQLKNCQFAAMKLLVFPNDDELFHKRMKKLFSTKKYSLLRTFQKEEKFRHSNYYFLHKVMKKKKKISLFLLDNQENLADLFKMIEEDKENRKNRIEKEVIN